MSDTPPIPSRRRFLARLSFLLSGAIGALASVPLLGALLEPWFSRPPRGTWRVVGPVDDFEVGKTVEVRFEHAGGLAWDGKVGERGAWLRREGPESFTAFAMNCAHLGCPVSWQQKARLFFCPCHGGVYYQDGSVAAGPPLQGLSRHPVRVRGRMVEIHTEPLPVTGQRLSRTSSDLP